MPTISDIVKFFPAKFSWSSPLDNSLRKDPSNWDHVPAQLLGGLKPPETGYQGLIVVHDNPVQESDHADAVREGGYDSEVLAKSYADACRFDRESLFFIGFWICGFKLTAPSSAARQCPLGLPCSASA